MTEIDYDLAIIGSGPGGYVAAIKAAQLNMSVLVIEKKDLGGICLNWGCIPTKSILRSAEIFDYIKNSSDYGIKSTSVKPDLMNIIKRSRSVAKKLSDGINFLFKKNKINLIYGKASINEKKEIIIVSKQQERKVKAKNIIIATGAKPKKIRLSNSFKVWDYFDALSPSNIPKSIGIIGSGAIGIEFASFYRALGSEVQVFEMQNKILPNEDDDVSVFLNKSLTKKGILFNLNNTILDITKEKDYKLKCKDSKSEKINYYNFEQVLEAIGIEGNIENLGLENTNIKIKNNQIVTYEFGKTDEDNIYAIGDVAGAPWLAHKASHEGIACAEYIAGKSSSPSEKMVIPSCVYSNPQVASIGITEQNAKKQGMNIKVGKFPLSANGKALSLSESDGFVKTIFEASTGQILGAHLVGVEVTELINSFSLAMKLEATELDIFSTIFPHPTISESIHESALDAYDKAIHI